jgi:hypothetical protein
MQGALRILIIIFLSSGSLIAHALPLSPDQSDNNQLLVCEDRLQDVQAVYDQECSKANSFCSDRCEREGATNKARENCRKACVDCESLKQARDSLRNQCGNIDRNP